MGGCVPDEIFQVFGGTTGCIGVASAVITGVVVIVVEETSKDRGCGFKSSLDEVGAAVLTLYR